MDKMDRRFVCGRPVVSFHRMHEALFSRSAQDEARFGCHAFGTGQQQRGARARQAVKQLR
jgi:hypothetical protein